MKHQTTATTSKRVATCLFGLLLSGLTTHAFGQANSPAVPPKPSAPKRHYEPASFFAQPDLQCKVYPAGSANSQTRTITVFTNDDGYARFHAVRATGSGDVQRLAADCTDSAGVSHSYSVDLTSDDTFRPRPLDVSKERGIDRPALEGDPLSYTQEELLHAGYGLRPDPKDTAAYARWLSAATIPLRMLTATRPHPMSGSRQTPRGKPATPEAHADATADAKITNGPNTVTKTTDPWWVGSTLNGAPKYVGAEATFEVPTPIPSGDETLGGTIIAIWTGVDGGDEALIQAGVNVQTTASTAVFWSWREFCCGDGISNSYSGAFTPNAGDKIYSDSWYCDSVGRLNVNGGYGCSYLADLTSGLVLSCIKAEGSPCPSAPAAPSWTSFGIEADFVIEDQTPQMFKGWSATTSYLNGQIANYDEPYAGYPYIALANNTNEPPSANPGFWAPYPRGTAFTDFTPTVTMSGSAYSTTTGSSSQTVTNDPQVDELLDFTNTSSHMEISLGTTDQTYFTSSQFKEVSGLASNAANIESIGVGPTPGPIPNIGDGWTLGFNANQNGDYNIYQWQKGGWVQIPGAGTHLAVSPEGYAWVVNHAGVIFYWNGSSFQVAPGNACASWIAVGGGGTYGTPWTLGCHTQTNNNYNIYELQGSTWVQQPGEATRIAVGPNGPWVINSAGNVFYWVNGNFTVVPGTVCGTSIAVGPNSNGTTFGTAWITGCHFQSTGYNIYQLGPNWSWEQVPGQASQIAVSPDWGVPWIVNSNGNIYE
ncbi:MAG: tectonin domain-containing protein [Bryobacteraceae bacterium]